VTRELKELFRELEDKENLGSRLRWL